ncbi:MAG: S46 family peptidase [Bacteroidetes bacterium]|nr:S46 family peptidase [Bacteroidota bacterium]
MKNISLALLSLVCLGLVSVSATKDEGMFPLNYLDEKVLQNAGLKLSTRDLFSPGEVSLANALVKVGGCSGSFISPEGLIITNHHCVYGGVADLSTRDNNYLENGFVASNKTKELPINMPCRITQSFADVSARVLQGVTKDLSPSAWAKAIAANIKNILAEEKVKNPDLSMEVSEMFVGRSYMLFRYLLIPDVRLVFAPPVTIGQFGGDLDNWEWPRHNGDFGMVRAYVGPDGKPAPYNKDNVPFKPRKHLKINANGTKEGDFVFIMGYPGRTFRHESAPYLKFQQEKQLPLIQKWYASYIRQMKTLSEGNDAKFLAFAKEIQSLENVEKNYRGKIQGLTRTGLVAQKQADETAMHTLAMNANKESRKNIIPNLNAIWTQKTTQANQRFNYLFLNNQSAPFYAARSILNFSNAYANAKSADDKQKIMEEFRSSINQNYSIVDKDLEIWVLQELLPKVNANRNVKIKSHGKQELKMWISAVLSKDKLMDTGFVFKTLRTRPEKLLQYKSTLMRLVAELEEEASAIEATWTQLDQQLKSIMPEYLDMKESYKKGQFIPDANSTLRMTFGYIKRYKPNDAEIHLPYTTLKGVFEKANTAADYRLPSVVADQLRIKDVPVIFKDKETGEVAVAFLYNLDTTGGNSGSAVLDAEGNLIGINFDRSFTATINDYAWNDQYSRSIGCDIRYVLFVVKYVGKADYLLNEMGLTI